jgi:histidine ammonia-lyase
MTVVLTGTDLTANELYRVANDGERVELAPDAIAHMNTSRAVVEAALERGAPVYGLTTGVGVRQRVRLEVEEIDSYNRLVVLNHRIAFGPPAPEPIVRATLLRLANGFARGTAGVRPELAQYVVQSLNENRLPTVRSSGSLGQADIGPMADIAFEVMSHLTLTANEGLALVNNNAYSTACAALAVIQTSRLANTLELVASLDLEALGASVDLLDPAIAQQRASPGVARSLAIIRHCLAGSYLFEDDAARNLQDPLTFRSTPLVHGNLRDTIDFAARQLQIELNAPQENPMVLGDDDRIVAVSNFDIIALAASLDYSRIALATTLTSACERTVKLLQAPMTGLPEGLAPKHGLSQDGLSEFGKAAQAVTLEARLLAQPVSFEVASSTDAEGFADRVTMAPLAARRLAEMTALGNRLAAIALVVSCQAIDLRHPAQQGQLTRVAHQAVREHVPLIRQGDVIPQNLDALVERVAEGDFSVTTDSTEVPDQTGAAGIRSDTASAAISL